MEERSLYLRPSLGIRASLIMPIIHTISSIEPVSYYTQSVLGEGPNSATDCLYPSPNFTKEGRKLDSRSYQEYFSVTTGRGSVV
jgi:hypothetical protein